MDSQIKVSIIVPVYNVEKYISRCFNSVANQYYNNIECIFVDDASPDNSQKILKKHIKKYQGEINFKIIKHPQNRGLSVARNTGTSASTGDYIYHLDSDDEITPNCIELLVGKVSKYKNVDIVQGNTKTIPQPNPKSDWKNIIFKNYPEYTNNKKWIKKHCFIEPRVPVTTWNKLIRKDFLIQNNLFFKEGIIHQDEHWMFFAAKKIKEISFVEEFTYIYYITPNSITQSADKNKSVSSWLVIIEELLENIDEFLPSPQKRYIFKAIKRNMLKINREQINKNTTLQYQALIKENLLLSIKSFKIIDCLFFFIFLFPPRLYDNFLARKFSSVLRILV